MKFLRGGEVRAGLFGDAGCGGNAGIQTLAVTDVAGFLFFLGLAALAIALRWV